MKLTDELNNFIASLTDATPETIDKAKRSINPDQIKNSFRANAVNVILSDVMKQETATINGNEVTYGVYPIGYFSPADGKLLGTGTCAASIFLRQVYPNNGEATDPQCIVKGVTELGADGTEIAANIHRSGKGIIFAEKKGMFRPVFNQVTRTMEYSNMTKRDATFYKVADLPESVAKQLK